jgi:hypothetical protein
MNYKRFCFGWGILLTFYFLMWYFTGYNTLNTLILALLTQIALFAYDLHKKNKIISTMRKQIEFPRTSTEGLILESTYAVWFITLTSIITYSILIRTDMKLLIICNLAIIVFFQISYLHMRDNYIKILKHLINEQNN